MAWCPKCKNEYVEGIVTCPDCGIDLVEELPEEADPEAPVELCTVADEQVGSKFVAYLNYGGIQTAGLIPNKDGSFQVAVAGFEKEAASAMFANFDSVEEMAGQDISELIPDIEKQLEELEAEEADAMFSDLRKEASTVYVKKKDKYADLKFSGISFILFGILGFALLAVNMMGYISLFNKFSSLIMGIVFAIFLIIGILSMQKAEKLKNLVSEEERATDEVLAWIEKNITDEWIASLVQEDQTEENNYFSAHAAMCRRVSEAFPFFSRDYVDQLMDDRYNDFCENMPEKEKRSAEAPAEEETEERD